MKSNHNTIAEICAAIDNNDIDRAKDIINTKYPFVTSKRITRQFSNYQKTKIFLRDGFIDRYSGEKLVFPPVLRLLSNLMPEEFPFHEYWKMTQCHIAYWQLFPTIDHIVPVARGGTNNEKNCVCTSQLRNSAKSNWLLEELGWQLHKPGNLNQWDGLINWYIAYFENHEIKDNYMQTWYKVAKDALG